jgi:lipoprotein-anchoring transpeptidase ErfK/SrfK
VKPAGRALGIGLLAALAVVGFSAAFALASVADAGTATPNQGTDPPTTTEPPTEPPTTTEPPPPRQPLIPSGVSIGHVDVGGMQPYEASGAVRKAFSRPLILVATPTRQLRVKPTTLGADPNVKKAVSRARFSTPGTTVPLHVRVSLARIRSYVTRVGRQYRRAPVDARLVLRGAAVRAVVSADGRRLALYPNANAIRASLQTNDRQPIKLEFSVLKPKVTEKQLGAAIVIMRETKKLRLFVDAKLVRTFGVATGQSSFPTPIGAYEIVTKQRNPWWYPPPSDWAADADPVPPGPGNPLGTRWMGISAPYVGIHGTPDAASIGYSASHGCVRMRIWEAEWLFNHVEVGTPVFIVSR